MSDILSSSNFHTPIQGDIGSTSSASLIDRFEGRFKIRFDKDASYRQKKLILLKLFLESEIYDNLYPFHVEFSGGNSGDYVKLADRRPSVTYPISKIIVDASAGLLFGEQHFPIVRCEDCEETTKFLQYITRVCHLKELMLLASKMGSIGSVCIIVKVLNGKFYFEAMETKNLSPVFDRMQPDSLIEVTEKKKVDGSTLKSFGYSIAEDNLNKFYWIIKKWDRKNETIYAPYLCEKEDDETFSPTEEKKSTHDFGFVPIIWIKNLPSNNIDGACTFQPALDMSIEMDYQISQNGRLLKYNSDPTFVVKNPNTLEGGDLIKGIKVLSLDEKGDAYYAEMSGKSCESVLNFVNQLREYALEAVRGNRSSPDKMSMAQSGIGFEMMNMSLVNLVEELRLTYGEYGLISLYQMIINIARSGKYTIKYKKFSSEILSTLEEDIILDWPKWYPQTSQEELQESQAITNYVDKRIISKKTALKSVADKFSIINEEDELKSIEEDIQKDYNNESLAIGADRLMAN